MVSRDVKISKHLPQAYLTVCNCEILPSTKENDKTSWLNNSKPARHASIQFTSVITAVNHSA